MWKNNGKTVFGGESKKIWSMYPKKKLQNKTFNTGSSEWYTNLKKKKRNKNMENGHVEMLAK